MRPLSCLSLVLALWIPQRAGAEEVHRYRQWIEGVESGEMEVTFSPKRVELRAWTQMKRLGTSSRQEIAQTATKAPDGTLNLSWKVFLSKDPLQGQAVWSANAPDRLSVTIPGASPIHMAVPSGAVLWPGDSDAILRTAAKDRKPVHIVEFSGTTQQWARTDLEPVGPEALPGFSGVVRFKGTRREGLMTSDMDIWISPSAGEIKQLVRMAGLTMLLQRAELPPPEGPESNFFERTLGKLPSHPFLPWIPEAVLKWEGQGLQELPQDSQQTKLGENHYRVRAASKLSSIELAEKPVTGTIPAEEAPFLAPSPLLQFHEPAFSGLMIRMNPPKAATRWELAKLVTSFVFTWITDKDLSVGFASASEVARIPRGDCTEHAVLAVALLRKLGVPSRGVVGWAGLGKIMGVHYWVEVKIGRRWIPLDPTFDQAPASTLRLKVTTTDLSDLANSLWDTTSLRLAGGTWVPGKPWTESIRLDGESVIAPDGTALRIPGGHWSMKEDRLYLQFRSNHEFEAVAHPTPQQLAGAKLLSGTGFKRRGWWDPRSRVLWVDMGQGRWARADRMDEPSAFALLDLLEIRP